MDVCTQYFATGWFMFILLLVVGMVIAEQLNRIADQLEERNRLEKYPWLDKFVARERK